MRQGGIDKMENQEVNIKLTVAQYRNIHLILHNMIQMSSTMKKDASYSLKEVFSTKIV